ncbi:hypothetical protein V3481_019265 [Fusarium oxysporum f. sp. vasinfectum]
MSWECSFTGTAKSALDSSPDINRDDDEGAAQGQGSYYPEEQGGQGNNDPSPSSTTIFLKGLLPPLLFQPTAHDPMILAQNSTMK